MCSVWAASWPGSTSSTPRLRCLESVLDPSSRVWYLLTVVYYIRYPTHGALRTLESLTSDMLRRRGAAADGWSRAVQLDNRSFVHPSRTWSFLSAERPLRRLVQTKVSGGGFTYARGTGLRNRSRWCTRNKVAIGGATSCQTAPAPLGRSLPLTIYPHSRTGLAFLLSVSPRYLAGTLLNRRSSHLEADPRTD